MSSMSNVLYIDASCISGVIKKTHLQKAGSERKLSSKKKAVASCIEIPSKWMRAKRSVKALVRCCFESSVGAALIHAATAETLQRAESLCDRSSERRRFHPTNSVASRSRGSIGVPVQCETSAGTHALISSSSALTLAVCHTLCTFAWRILRTENISS